MIKRRVAILGGVIAAAITGSGSAAGAVTEGDFIARTTQQLADLCAAPPADPLRVAASHFCQGYVAGATAYHQIVRSAVHRGPDFCMPQPSPTREQVAARFVGWARNNPQFMNDAPIDGLFRFLETTWPCRKP